MRNCPNCGAPIDPYKNKCEYCGTYYYDFTNINFEHNKPCYIQFKIDDFILTTLAIPHMETINFSSDTIDVIDTNGCSISSYRANKECNIELSFSCIEDKDHSLLEIRTK